MKILTNHSENSLHIPEVLQKDYYPSLDGVRAVSILLVLLAHLSNAYPFPSQIKAVITQVGLLGVQVFFVISGFLITTLLLKEQVRSGTISLKNFYMRRAFRILPLVFLYLWTLLFVNDFFQLNVPLRSFVGAALFLANISAFKGNWFTAHFWSLSTEEQYYLIFPFLLKKFTRCIHFVVIFILLFIVFIKEAAFLQIPLFPYNDVANTFAFLLFQSEGVLVGSLLSISWFRNKVPVKFLNKHRTLFYLILPVLIFIIYTNLITIHSFNSLIATLFIAILLAVLINDMKGLVFSFLNQKMMVTIGKLSFSIYIWQQLFTSPDGRFGSFSRLPKNVLVIILISSLSYYLIEKPFLRLKKRFTKS